MYLEGFYFPRWTKKIESEFLRNFPAVAFGKTRAERNLIRKNPPTPSHLVAATKRLNAFRNAVGPECEVFLYDQKTFTDQVPLNIPTVHSMKLQFK